MRLMADGIKAMSRGFSGGKQMIKSVLQETADQFVHSRKHR